MNKSPRYRLLYALLCGCCFLHLGGCFGALRTPPRRYFTLSLPTTQPPALPCKLGNLRLRTLLADPPYDQTDWIYRPNAYEIRFTRQEAWVAPPAVLIGDWLLTTINASGLFREASREWQGDNPDYVLNGHLRAVELLAGQKAGQWRAHLSLELELTHAHSGRVVWQHAFDKESPPLPGKAIDSPQDLQHAAQTLSSLLAAGLGEALNALAARCPRHND